MATTTITQTTSHHEIQLSPYPSQPPPTDIERARSQPIHSILPAIQPSPKLNSILIVAASFTLTFTGCGINFAFGVYQELYQSLADTSTPSNPSPFANASPATIDLIGTLGVSLMTMFAPLAAAGCKAFSPRTITLLGAFLFALGLLLASYATSLTGFLVTQGVLLGIGTCAAYIPAVTVAPGWFDQRRGLAMGVVLAGTGVGGVFWAPVIRLMNDSFGFRNGLRVLAGVGFVLIAGASFAMKWDAATLQRNRVELAGRTGLRRMRIPLVNWHLVRSRKFAAQALGCVLQAAAYYTPIYFFSAYSRVLGYSAASGANFIAMSNAASAVGKVVIGHLADRFGRLNTLAFCTVLSAVTALGLWLPSTLTAGEEKARILFAMFAITYGIFAGAYISLFPIALVELFGVQNFSSVNGVLYMLRGFGSLIGTPTAGALLRDGPGSASMGYEKLSTMVGTLMAGAAVAVLWVRIESVDLRAPRWRA
ncbi:MFS general substrate transporter [Microthyrium microscopicum]|uniref:MFS general substrate transporter n=1 Tax=Microthyrium microscopicum TaxID=703497 RepID=A0A6A6TX51_9PEZI|nr:MFS general substrate transporter [Microthyrium microscopicum]